MCRTMEQCRGAELLGQRNLNRSGAKFQGCWWKDFEWCCMSGVQMKGDCLWCVIETYVRATSKEGGVANTAQKVVNIRS